MHELLLQPSSRLDIDSLRGYAIQMGLDVVGDHEIPAGSAVVIT
jgi:hypothetical protein